MKVSAERFANVIRDALRAADKSFLIGSSAAGAKVMEAGKRIRRTAASDSFRDSLGEQVYDFGHGMIHEPYKTAGDAALGVGLVGGTTAAMSAGLRPTPRKKEDPNVAALKIVTDLGIKPDSKEFTATFKKVYGLLNDGLSAAKIRESLGMEGE